MTTSDFVINSGVLSIIENLDTSGNLDISHGTVKVAQGRWAVFD